MRRRRLDARVLASSSVGRRSCGSSDGEVASVVRVAGAVAGARMVGRSSRPAANPRADGRGEHRGLTPKTRRWTCSRSPIAGASVAACTGECFLLADDLAYRPPGDPELVFVVMMCAYASDVARGLLPGPFDNVDARRYARAALVPQELLERPELDIDRAPAALGVPARELRAARDEPPRGSAGDGGAETPAGAQRAGSPAAGRRRGWSTAASPTVPAGPVRRRWGGGARLRRAVRCGRAPSTG